MKILPFLLSLLLLTGANAAQSIIDLGTGPNSKNGTPIRTALGMVNSNFTEVYTGLSDLSFTKVSLEGDETINGQKTFNFSPLVPVQDEPGVTALVIGKSYQRDISENTTMTFVGTPSEGSRVTLNLRVIETPTITFPASKRSSEADAAVTSIRLWPGLHTLQWERVASEWRLFDTVYTRNMVTTTDPTVNSGALQGFGPFSKWLNTAGVSPNFVPRLWECGSGAVGAAVWKEVGGAGNTDAPTVNGAQVLSYALAGTLTTGTGKLVFHLPYAATFLKAEVAVGTVATSGLTTFDINKGSGTGTTILSTKITIDPNEDHSANAATQPVYSETNFPALTRFTMDVDTIGSTPAPADARLYITIVPWDGTGGSGGSGGGGGGGGSPDYLTGLENRITFEEGTGSTINDAIGGMVGTAAAGGEFVAGKVGTWAYSFDADERINFGDVGIWAGKSTFTTMWWFKKVSGSSEVIMIRKFTNSGSLEFNATLTGGNTPKAETRTAATVVNAGTAIADTNWHHFAVTYDGANQKLYIDGVLKDTDPQTGAIMNNSASLYFGAPVGFPPTIIDEFRQYSTALTQAQIAQHVAWANALNP